MQASRREALRKKGGATTKKACKRRDAGSLPTPLAAYTIPQIIQDIKGHFLIDDLINRLQRFCMDSFCLLVRIVQLNRHLLPGQRLLGFLVLDCIIQS